MEDTFSGLGNGTKYVSVGRFFYSSNIKRPQLLGNGLQSWRGFYQSLKPTQMGLSLNIDMSATAFIEPLPVIEFVAQVLGKDVYSRPLSDADYVKVKKALRGVKVEVTHRGNMQRKYCISGSTSQPTRELIFPVDEEKNMKSVIDYFQEVYGFTIRHSHLPCLLVGSARKVNYLPMEACKIVEGQRYSKRLNDKLITSLLKLSCQRPKEQEAEILQVKKDLRGVKVEVTHGKHAKKVLYFRVDIPANKGAHDWATMKGYSLGDERPVEVISLSTHAKLVPRLQLIYISWLGRFSPRPSALAGGGEIGGPIALSLSESATTKNIAQRVRQDQSGSASDSENERTREEGDPKEINATITFHDIRRHYGRRNREDAAASLAISVATFKRKCREFGIKRWPHVRKRKVGRPPDQHGEGNTSTARETPSRYVQTGMEGELVGQNEVANAFQRDFMGGPIALNTESGLIMVLRPPDQHGERNTSTACGAPSRNVENGMEVEPIGQNQEANVFRRDFMYGPIALNTDGLMFPECSDAVAPSQPMATILDTIPHLNGGSSECAFQVKNPSTQFTAYPNPNGLVDPHPQIASTQMLSENMEIRSCSDLALSQPMPTIPHTTGCSEYWRNSLALLEEHLLEENDYGSINLTAPSCFDPGPSQPMHTTPHTMPTIPQMMPLLTERQDMRSVRLKATYGNTTIKFPLPSGFSELKEEVSKRLEFERGSFKLEYKDEDGDSVLIACDEDLRDYLQLLTSLGNQVVKLFVLDKVPNTTNFCDNCRSLKCKRT